MNEWVLFRIPWQSQNFKRETVSSLYMDRIQTSVSLDGTLCLELILDSSSHGKSKNSCLIGQSLWQTFKCTRMTPRAVHGGSVQSDWSTFLSLSCSSQPACCPRTPKASTLWSPFPPHHIISFMLICFYFKPFSLGSYWCIKSCPTIDDWIKKTWYIYKVSPKSIQPCNVKK